MKQSKRTYSSLSDAELFRVFLGTREEKEGAFEEMYSRYSNKVYLFCLRLSGNSDDANDIFQETFTRFFNHEYRSEMICNIAAYLIASARNIFLNCRRSTARFVALADDEAPVFTNPYEREELCSIVGAALECLDTPYREAFILRFYQGLSYKEISQITGDTVASLKVRVMRAKDQVRRILAPWITDLAKHG